MSLLRASLAQQGVTGLRRRLGTLVVLASLLAITWWSLRRALPGVVAAFADDPQRGYAALASIMHTGPLGVLVWPLEAVVAPLLASSAAAFASRVPAALLVLGAHYIWVVRSTLAFEEAAVEHAAKLARRIEAVRQGRWAARPSHAAKSTGRIRLRLAPTGGPGVAILWKNTVGATRDLSQRTFILIAVVVIGGSIALASGPMRGLDLVAVLLLGIGGLTLLFGPLAARCDLRQDLEMLDLLKGYPVRGRQVVGGEVAAPVTLIGLVVWSCLLGAFAATAGRQGSDLPSLGDRLAVLLFPAWVSVGRDRAVGLEATGQRILMTAGSMVVLVVALVPAVVVGGIAGVAARAGGLPLMWAVTVASLMGSAVVLFEGVLAVHLLGGVFDRMDSGTAGTG